MACDEIMEEMDEEIMAFYQHGKEGKVHDVICSSLYNTFSMCTCMMILCTHVEFCVEAEKKADQIRAELYKKAAREAAKEAKKNKQNKGKDPVPGEEAHSEL